MNWIAAISLVLFISSFILYLSIFFFSRRYIQKIYQINKTKYALVLGAGLEKNGKPCDILMDRMETAVDLFRAGKVDYLILSGTRKSDGYDEPGAMRRAAITFGIQASSLFSDTQGYSTFNSCVNLLNRFSPSEVIVVTQNFHLPRAITLLRSIGIHARGIQANTYRFSFYKKAYWYLREVLALPFNLLKLFTFSIKRCLKK